MIGSQGENLIFTISQPRAGSTLLQRILAGHSSIFATAEPWIMLHPLYALRDSGHTAEYNEQWARLAFKDFCQNLDGGESAYLEAVRALGVSLYNNALGRAGGKHACFLDKTPRYYYICSELRRTFPQAKFILLLRNPLAVLSSILTSWIKEDWARLDLYQGDLLRAPALLDGALREFGDGAIRLRYEELVEQPEAVVRALCAQLGLPFEPGMIEYGNSPKPKGKMGDDVGIDRFTRPVVESKEKWLKDLATPRARLLAESYLAALDEGVLARLGYPREALRSALRAVPVPSPALPAAAMEHAAKFFSLPPRTIAGLCVHWQTAPADGNPNGQEAAPFVSMAAAPEAPARSDLRPATLQCVEQADQLLAAGDRTGARDWLERALDLEPNRSELLVALANLQGQTGDLEGAVITLARAAVLQPGDALIQVLLGSVYARLDRVPEFETAVARALELEPGHPAALRLLAGLNLERRHYADAARLYQSLVSRLPDDLEARLSLGKCLFETGDAAGAAREFAELIRRQPDHDLARENLAIAHGRVAATREQAGTPAVPAQAAPGAPPTRPREQPAFHAPAVLVPAARPRITLVTPSFNQGRFLEECLDSVLSQNYPNLEYIVMDGGSADNSAEVLKKYGRHLAHWQSERDAGQYHAVQAGFERSTGNIMAWLNSDDKLHPGALDTVAALFAHQAEVEWILGRPTAWTEAGLLRLVAPKLPEWSREKYLAGSFGEGFIQQESTFWRRGLWTKAGGRLQTRWKLAADFELWARFFRHARLCPVDALLAGFRQHDQQKTAQQMLEYRREVESILVEERAWQTQHPIAWESAPPPLQAGRVLRESGGARITPANFSYFTYSKHPHFDFFRDHDRLLHGQTADPTRCDLKVYQDLLVYTFIRDNIRPGARLLEIGGGDSRVLKALCRDYECWNLDKLEGQGNGLTAVDATGCRLVKDYLGNFSPELPDGFFDFVFSISVIEHLAEEDQVYRDFCLDLDRVLKVGGYSLHCVDVVQANEVRAHGILPFLFEHLHPVNRFIPFAQLPIDPHTFYMTEAAYNRGWKPITRRSYEQFGRPLSYNLLWHKTAENSPVHLRPERAPARPATAREVGRQPAELTATAGATAASPQGHDQNQGQGQTQPGARRAPARPAREPLVSVIVSVHAAERYLRACLEDLVAQTLFDRLEVIVIDSGSPENERAIVEEFQKRHPNIQYHRTERETLYAAWNRAIGLAKGKYMANANADDAHRSDALEILAAALEAHPEADLAYGDYYTSTVPNDSFADPHILRHVVQPPYHPATVMMYCVTGCHPMWRRTVFDQIGLFDPTFTAPGDYELLFRFVQAGRRAVHVPQPLSLFYQNPDGLSWKSAAQTKSEGDRILGQYRTRMPIERVFRVDPADLPAAARAWTALGNVALQHEMPWFSNYTQALPYARMCYERALQLHVDCAAAKENLAILRLLQQPPSLSEAALGNLLSPDRVAAVRKDLAAGRLRPVPVPLPPAVDPIDFGEARAGVSFQPAVLPGPADDRANGGVTLAVRLAAPFLNHTELAEEARSLALTLAGQVNLSTYDLAEPYSYRFDAALPEKIRRTLQSTRAGFNLAVGGIGLSLQVPGRLSRIQGAAYQIGRTYFEADRVPLEAARICNQMDELWVPSTFVAEALAAGGVEREKLVVIPGAVDTREFDPERHQPWPLPRPAGCNLLARFEWSVRKGWDVLLSAYIREFSAEEDVCLYIHAHVGERPERESRVIIEQQMQECLKRFGLADRPLPRIELLLAEIPLPELPRLYRAAQAVVCPSRGESWNRTAHEAMAMGLPVVATNWGGHVDLVTEQTGYLIRCVTKPASNLELHEWPYHGAQWADPSVDHLRELLRQVQAHPDEARARGAQARSRIGQLFSNEIVSAQITARLQTIEERLSKPWCPPATARAKSARAGQVDARSPVTVSLEGSFLDFGSLSHVNRELSRQLARQPGMKVTCVGKNVVPPELAQQPLLVETARHLKYPAPKNAQVTIRQAWPPDWERPAAGAWVLMQPWEYGVLPEDWTQRLTDVDEIWAISEYVRKVYVESGVDPHKVKVVPNGIDPERFRPGAPPMALATQKRIKFLFVGGTIQRKGADVLLRSYLENFSAADDVCLVIKDFGAQNVYAGQTLEREIRAAQAATDAPEILYLNQDLAPEALPGLYTACDCLVHPYRGEGFGLPVLEAMACGLPVIVTGGGATDDFATDEFVYRIPALRREIGPTVGGLKLHRPGWLLEPDAAALVERMKWVAAYPEVARKKAAAASEHVRRDWTWERAAQIAAQRLHQLVARRAAAAAAPAKLAQAVTLPPAAKAGHVGPAREAFKQGHLLAAWDATAAALRARPFHPEGMLLLAEICQAAGDGKRAKELAERARKMAPQWKPAQQFLKKPPAKGTAKVALPDLPGSVLGSASNPRLSVFLITKNEERFLGQCLASVRDLAHQIVVADTGSTDWTRDIAGRYGAEVISVEWNEDFSAARNAALERVTGDWVLMLDADEELLPDQAESLRQAMRDPKAIAYRLPIIDRGREEEGASYVPRLFRNAPGLFYIGRVHEQVFSSIEARRGEWGLENCLGTARLLHHGYTKEMVRSRDKVARNLRLLQRALEELPGEPNLLMNLGLELVRAGYLHEGLDQYSAAFRALSALSPEEVVPELRETLLTQLCTHLLSVKDFAAVGRALHAPLARQGGLTATMHWLLGLACIECKQYAEGAEQMRQCLAKRDQPVLSPVNKNILKAGPNHCLALCLAALKQTEPAARAFQAALREDPNARAVQFDYARLLADTGQGVEALKWIHPLAMHEPSNVVYWQFGGYVALTQPEFLEFALDWTGEAHKLFPAHPPIVEQRAQALLLGGHIAAALPLWHQLGASSNPSHRAALLLCQAVHDQPLAAVPAEMAPRLNQEFLLWYRRLLGANAVKVIHQINERLNALRVPVPAAVQAVEAAMAEAGSVEQEEV